MHPDPAPGPDANSPGPDPEAAASGEQERLEHELGLSHLRFQAIIDSTADGYWRAHLDGRILEVNEAYCRMSGYTREELLGMRVQQIDALDSPERILERSEQVRREGTVRFESRHRAKDGHLLELEITLTLVPSTQEAVAFFRNLTEGKRAQEALAASEARLAALVQNSWDILSILDADGTLLYNSPACERIHGFTPEELLGRSTVHLMHPQDAPRVAEAMAWLLAHPGEPVTVEYRYACKDGRWIWMEAVGVNHLDHPGIRGIVANSRDISDRKAAEERFRSSEALYRELLERQGEGFGMVDAEERFLFANPVAEAIFGVGTGGLVGRSLMEFLDESQRRRVQAETRKRRQGEASTYELEIDRPDGLRRTILVTATPRTPSPGEAGQVFGVFRDITELKQRDEALQASERMFQRLLESASVPIGVADAAGRIEYLNLRFIQDFGYQPEDLPDLDAWWARAYPDPDYRKQVQAVWAEAVARSASLGGDVSMDEVFQVTCGDGQVRLVKIWGALAGDRVIVFMHDQTEQVRTEEALRDALELSDRMVSSQPMGVLAYHAASGRCVRANEAIARTLGTTLGELLAQNFREIPSWRESGLLALAERALATGEEQSLETRILSTFGRECWISAFFSAFQSGGETHLLLLCQDITELKAAAEARAKLEAQMARSQKLESLGSLAGGVAHDMNNVLGAIMGLASVHQMVQPEGSSLRRDMDTIVKACQRGGTLVKGLLGFARQELAEERDVDLNALVRDQVQLLSRTTLQRVQMVMELQEGLPVVRGDASSLSHALMNLCVNAVDAMDPGGTLTLRTSQPQAGSVRLEVIDTGSGMSPEVLEKALDPFFTTKPQGKGTGLGLPIVYGAVKAHRGRLEIDSAPGRGTRVVVHLPVAREPQPSTAPEAHAHPEARGLSILLVDDDELLRDSVTQLLVALGHRVEVAGSGEEALERLKAGLGPDAVLLDLNMPGLGGAATLPRLRQLRPGVPVLLATGRVDQEALDLVHAFQGVSLMPKPFSLKELQQQLEPIGRR